MAQTTDRRSEGKNSSSSTATSLRKLRAERKALNLCITCGVEHVKNRVECYKCVDKKMESQIRSHFRKHLSNFDLELNEIIETLSDKPKYKKLKSALVAALPKI
jgi:hypothetical protein